MTPVEAYWSLAPPSSRCRCWMGHVVAFLGDGANADRAGDRAGGGTRRPIFRSRPGRVLLLSTLLLVPPAFAVPYLPGAEGAKRWSYRR